MTKEEIAANIVIAMIQKPEFKVMAPDARSTAAFTEEICKAYAQIYKAIKESTES